MPVRTALVAALAIFTASPSRADVTTLTSLFDAIDAGPNRAVGFLSQGNYETVKNVLPANVQVVIAEDTDHLYQAVRNGTLVAGLISGVPDASFHQFSSTLVSTRAIQINGPRDSRLMEAIDAAVVRVMAKGISQKLARKNAPFKFLAVRTCPPDPNAFPWPSNASDGTRDAWARILESKRLVFGALGPNDWKQDGNYLISPPKGFWPDYYETLCTELTTQYAGLACERRFFGTSAQVLAAIADGSVDVTEPYWTVDSSYKGRGRKSQFATSCVVLGIDSTFFTRSSSFDDTSFSTASEVTSLITSDLDRANAAKKLAEADLADLDKQIGDKQRLLAAMSEQVLQRGARSTSRAPSFVQRGLAVWPLAASFAAVLLLRSSNNI